VARERDVVTIGAGETASGRSCGGTQELAGLTLCCGGNGSRIGLAVPAAILIHAEQSASDGQPPVELPAQILDALVLAEHQRRHRLTLARVLGRQPVCGGSLPRCVRRPCCRSLSSSQQHLTLVCELRGRPSENCRAWRRPVVVPLRLALELVVLAGDLHL
jgi:hypothetical protein